MFLIGMFLIKTKACINHLKFHTHLKSTMGTIGVPLGCTAPFLDVTYVSEARVSLKFLKLGLVLITWVSTTVERVVMATSVSNGVF